MCLGIPGQVIEIVDAEKLIAIAEVSGVRREVNIACIADANPQSSIGKWVLIHVGFAMVVIDEAEAARTLEAFRELGEVQEALDAMAAGDAALRTGR